MKKIGVSGCITWHDIDLEYEGEFTPGDPGKVSGPPENCYPPEPSEIEITKLELHGVDVLCLLETDYRDDICELALKDAEEAQRD